MDVIARQKTVKVLLDGQNHLCQGERRGFETRLPLSRIWPVSRSEFMHRLLGVEVVATEARRRAGLKRFAWLPSPWTLDDFDFSAQPSVDKKLMTELETLRFLEDATNVHFH
jgi:hypothetical protein